MTYELHPLCVLFPRLTGAEFNSLRDDIKSNGLRSPIVLHDGMILDGGNRYQACLEAGVEPVFEEFEGGNLATFVLSVNLHRRHMTAPQQAAIVSSARNWAEVQTHGGDRRSDQALSGALDSTKARAAESGASISTQRRSDAVAKADPELAKQVGLGNVSLPRAVERVAPQLASRKTVPVAKTPKQIEADQAADDAHSDFDPLVELENANKELESLHAQLDAAEADDQKAETLKWRRAHQVAEKRQGEIMDAANNAQKHAKFLSNQLARCGRAVGETDPDKIAPTVEAFVRKHTKVAA